MYVASCKEVESYDNVCTDDDDAAGIIVCLCETSSPLIIRRRVPFNSTWEKCNNL